MPCRDWAAIKAARLEAEAIPDDGAKFYAASLEEGLALLDGWTGTAVATTLLRYTVRTTTGTIDQEEVMRRRSPVADVIARYCRRKGE